MSSYEYSSSSSGGAGGFDAAKAIFNQADTNQDGTIDRNEFSQWIDKAAGGGQYGLSGAGGAGQFGISGAGGAGQFGISGAGGAGQYDLSGAGGAGGSFGSSYESSSYSSAGGVGGGLGVDGGYAGASSFESSGLGLDADAVGGSSFQSSFESSTAGGAGYDLGVISQAAGYTAETNASWSRYGAEVTGAGLYIDANPQIIRRPASGVQTYTQNIKIRFLQPPPVPPPGVSDHFYCVVFFF
jgi:hypothetical protein